MKKLIISMCIVCSLYASDNDLIYSGENLNLAEVDMNIEPDLSIQSPQPKRSLNLNKINIVCTIDNKNIEISNNLAAESNTLFNLLDGQEGDANILLDCSSKVFNIIVDALSDNYDNLYQLSQSELQEVIGLIHFLDIPKLNFKQKVFHRTKVLDRFFETKCSLSTIPSDLKLEAMGYYESRYGVLELLKSDYVDVADLNIERVYIISTIKVSNDGKLLVAGYHDGTLLIKDNNKEIFKANYGSKITSLAIAQRDKTVVVVVGCEDGTLKAIISNFEGLNFVELSHKFDRSIICISISETCNRFIVSLEDQKEVITYHCSDDDDEYYVSGDYESAYIFNLNLENKIMNPEFNLCRDQIRGGSVGISGDGKYIIAMNSAYKSSVLFEIVNKQLPFRLSEEEEIRQVGLIKHNEDIKNVAISKDGNCLATVSFNYNFDEDDDDSPQYGTLIMSAVVNGQIKKFFVARLKNSGFVGNIFISPDNSFVVLQTSANISHYNVAQAGIKIYDLKNSKVYNYPLLNGKPIGFIRNTFIIMDYMTGIFKELDLNKLRCFEVDEQFKNIDKEDAIKYNLARVYEQSIKPAESAAAAESHS